MTPEKKRPAPASFEQDAKCEADATIKKCLPIENTKAKPARQYRDRFGHLHSAAVFQAWSPQLIAFMDLRLIDGLS